jgi:putative Mn2+ efflux pump MntP
VHISKLYISLKAYEQNIHRNHTETMLKFLKIFTWILIILSLFAFYISLRSDEYSMEYAMVALGLWVIALGANYLIRKKKK